MNFKKSWLTGTASRVARFFLTQYTKMEKNIPDCHYVNYQMAVKYINWQYYIQNGHKICQPFPIQAPPPKKNTTN
jgi:hypothetical protein